MGAFAAQNGANAYYTRKHADSHIIDYNNVNHRLRSSYEPIWKIFIAPHLAPIFFVAPKAGLSNSTDTGKYAYKYLVSGQFWGVESTIADIFHIWDR